MMQKVFNRYEKKYMLTEQQYCEIRKRLEEYAGQKSFPLRQIVW